MQQLSKLLSGMVERNRINVMNDDMYAMKGKEEVD
jgi:hypothetical protein